MIEKFDEMTDVLKSETVTNAVFAAAGSTISKAGENFDTDFDNNFTVLCVNAGLNNDVEFTLTNVTDTVLTVSPAPGNETINSDLRQVVYNNWRNISNYGELVAVINASQNCTAYLQQSFDRVTIDYSTTINVVGGVVSATIVDIVCTHARLKIVNGAVDQTSFNAKLAGRVN